MAEGGGGEGGREGGKLLYYFFIASLLLLYYRIWIGGVFRLGPLGLRTNGAGIQ